MNRNLLFVSVILVAILVVFLTTGYSGQSEKRLPGARSVIRAGEFSSLQEAIDALPEAGGLVEIPPGTFGIDRPLRISRSDVLLAGSGPSTHIENANTEGQPALIVEHPTREDSRQAELWRIQISNLRITGNGKSGHGIEARRVNELFIDNVTVSNHGGDGIRLYYCYEDPRISDSLVTYNKATGVNLIGCHDIVVSGNQFEENQDALRCTDGFNLCMTGNNLDDHLGDGVVIENTYGSVVAGNMIEECRGAAIVLRRDCYGTALSANVLAHNESGGISLDDAHGIAVSANAFTIMGKDALRIGPESGRINVTGNNFSDSYIGDGQLKRREDDRRAGGLILHSTRDIAVVGNLFAGLRPGAVTTQGEDSKAVLFSDNVILDSEAEYHQLADSLVQDNLQMGP